MGPARWRPVFFLMPLAALVAGALLASWWLTRRIPETGSAADFARLPETKL
jgi:hypothetical protein